MTDQHIKLLLIEDDPGDIRLMQEMLAESVETLFEVAIANRLAVGLERLSERKIDLILLDLTLPDNYGFDTFLKVHARAPQVPIIVLSGLDDEVLAVKAVREGAQDYLVKGQVDSNLLVRAIRYAIERKHGEEELKHSVEKLSRSFEGTIQAMALIVELRDPYTAGHQRRVAQLATAIARELKLSDEQVEGIRYSATIHDIGKIRIPAEILSKPGRLSQTESNLIMNHPEVGYEILKTIDFPWPIAQIVLQHHERINGSGYPNKLPGDMITPEAKILCVADVVEAMSSHRPYRPALGIESALEEIEKNRGILYDPEIVGVCLNLFRGGRFKFE